ncbi:citrate lyase holo-[acyl-carrier protein] synthase [Deltaproteobacteria bacterium OttesenSCG-928-M10]|nr:citrate lyase holo-[acyl-carrier protein] synthase [Deltaproteobacteria bacterium OttesenSCG-928-M10]
MVEQRRPTIFQANEQFDAILAGREKRAAHQRDLIRRFGRPLVSFSLNIPGPDKLSGPWGEVLKAGLEAVVLKMRDQNLDVRYYETGCTAAGHEAFLVVDAAAAGLKELAMAVELGHPLGRLFDIDVLDEHGAQLSRESGGGEKRACIVCGAPAALCRRDGKHTVEEVLRRFAEMTDAYFQIDGAA